MTQITLTLRDDVFRRAEVLAGRVGRPVAEVLAESIELSLQPLGARDDVAPADWSDADVLGAIDAHMPADRDQRLSELLALQKERDLSAGERTELAALMEMYQVGLLRKAQALSEAVRRGLREPLQP